VNCSSALQKANVDALPQVHDFPVMESDVVCFKSLPREQDVFRSLVAVGGGGYHLPAGSLVTLVAKQDKFRAETKCDTQLYPANPLVNTHSTTLLNVRQEWRPSCQAEALRGDSKISWCCQKHSMAQPTPNKYVW